MIATHKNPLKHILKDRLMLAAGFLLLLASLTPKRAFAQSIAISTTAVEQQLTVTRAAPAATPLVGLVLRLRPGVPGFPIFFRQPDGRWLYQCTTPCSLRVAPSTIVVSRTPTGANSVRLTVPAAGLDTIVLPSPDRLIPRWSDVNSATAARAGSPDMYYGGLTMIIGGTGLGFTFLGLMMNSIAAGRSCSFLCFNFEAVGWMGAAIGTPVIFLPIGIGMMVAGRDRPAQTPAQPRASLVGVMPIVTAEFQGVSVVGQF